MASRNAGTTSAATPKSAAPELGDNWVETRRSWRRLKAAWRGLWAQVFLGWALRCDEQAVVDFLWDAVDQEVDARKDYWVTAELAKLASSGPASVAAQVAQPIREDLESKGEA